MTASAHILQPSPDSCVAACTAILLGHMGHPTDVQTLIQDWEPPIALETPAAPYARLPHKLCYKQIDVTGETASRLDLYFNHILQKSWCIVTVFPAVMGSLAESLQFTTPHGALTQSRIRHHAIVLTAYHHTALTALDPYHHPTSQPFRIRRDLFYGELWTGELLYPQP